MVLRIRVILNVEEDVLRDIEIDESSSMLEFHKTISSSFGFDSSEPSTFFKSNNKWERDEEIKIFKLDENDKVYSDSSISEFINSKGDKLIYIYDFLNYWTFFIDVNESVEKIKDKDFRNLITWLYLKQTGNKATFNEVKWNPSFKDSIFFVHLNTKQDSAKEVAKFNKNSKNNSYESSNELTKIYQEDFSNCTSKNCDLWVLQNPDVFFIISSNRFFSVFGDTRNIVSMSFFLAAITYFLDSSIAISGRINPSIPASFARLMNF